MFSRLKFIICAFFLAEFGRTMYFVVITWLLYTMTEDPFFTGLLVSIGFVPGLVFNLFFGVVVDRLNRKVLSVTATLINTLAVAFLVVSIISSALDPWTILIVHMILQLMGSLFRPSIQAFIAEVFRDEELPKIYSRTGSAAIVGGLLGAAFGGIITGVSSEEVALLIVALCFSLATLLLTRLRHNPANSTCNTNETTIIHDLIEGFSYLKGNKILLSLFGIMLVGQLTFHTTIGFLSVYTKEYLNQTATVYGLLDACLSIGGVLAGLMGTWWWNKNGNYLSTRSLLVVILGLFVMAFSSFLPLVFMGVFLVGLGTTWLRVLLQSVQQILTEKQYHGRMASYRMLCNQGSVVVSGPIFGWIASANKANTVFLALTFPVIIAAIYSIIQAKQPKFKEVTQKSA
ncbi:MFS transporter [Halobacillus salinus]|uniref:MFS transporter n=1 Tax=Halobacillus salinus TaxID=192814 RepID=A0A4Z0H163_9BACI|nr:MFS transporter [Halobacillus salinus]TGB03624.1 MFS transporter [Halobacillus salinus]